MTDFFDIAYERRGSIGVCKGCGAVYEGTAAFAVKHANAGCIVPIAHSVFRATNAPNAVAAMGDLLGYVEAARIREERLRDELKEAMLRSPEWWGSQRGNRAMRHVHVRVGTTVISSDHAVRWARHVLSAMVFGLSYGRQGSQIVEELPSPAVPSVSSAGALHPWRCGRCGFVECSCLKVLRP